MKALDGIDVDPVDARVIHLTRLAFIRDLTAEEQVELDQLRAAEKSEPQQQEARQ